MMYLLFQVDKLKFKKIFFSDLGSYIASFIYTSQWFMKHIFMLHFIFLNAPRISIPGNSSVYSTLLSFLKTT